MLPHPGLFWEKAYLVDKEIYDLNISSQIYFFAPFFLPFLPQQFGQSFGTRCSVEVSCLEAVSVNKWIISFLRSDNPGRQFWTSFVHGNSQKMVDLNWNNRQNPYHNLLAFWSLLCAHVCQAPSCVALLNFSQLFEGITPWKWLEIPGPRGIRQLAQYRQVQEANSHPSSGNLAPCPYPANPGIC